MAHPLYDDEGAVRAANWLQGKSAGLYSMQNVLGLN
jgi:dihydrodipicolinate reductase